MTYAAFYNDQTEYMNRVTPQGTKESIPHIPLETPYEHDYGENYTTKLLNSDALQERLDILRAKAETLGTPFNEKKAKGQIISKIAGDLTNEAKIEYDHFIPVKGDPEQFMGIISVFYKDMTGKDLKKACHEPENEEKIKKVLNRDDLKGLSEIERAAALTAFQKTFSSMETIDLRNTNTLAQYHIVTIENKSANPLGFYASRIESLPQETQERIKPHADKMLPATHDGALWHEMTHTLGTDNESICEGFRYLKTLKKYGEPALLLPEFNARLYNNMDTLKTICKDVHADRTSGDGNFTYFMPKMMKYMVDHANELGEELKGMSDAEIMKKTQQIVKDCSYGNETEKALRNLLKECKVEPKEKLPEELAKTMLTVYNNGEKDPKTAAVYPLAKDMFEVAKLLDPKVTPETFFKPENFTVQARNIGKEERKTENVVLSEKEKKHYQNLYNEVKKENPNATKRDFDMLFAEAIVKDAWARKAKEEAKLEDPKQAASILFDKEKTAEMTKTINTYMKHARNAARIVKEYGPDFDRRFADKMKAPATAAKESSSPQKKSLMKTLLDKKKAQDSQKIAKVQKEQSR